MANEKKKQVKRVTEVVLKKSSNVVVREGYQPKASTLDKNNPPKGGSGVPLSTSNTVTTSKITSSGTTTTAETSSASETTKAKTSQDTSTKSTTKDKSS